jgi:hypothetical protein
MATLTRIIQQIGFGVMVAALLVMLWTAGALLLILDFVVGLRVRRSRGIA